MGDGGWEEINIMLEIVPQREVSDSGRKVIQRCVEHAKKIEMGEVEKVVHWLVESLKGVGVGLWKTNGSGGVDCFQILIFQFEGISP